MSGGSGDVHQVSLAIGRLQSSVENMTRMWQQQEEAAVDGRRKLHEKFEDFKDEVAAKLAALTGRVDKLAEQVTVIEPSVKSFNDEKLRTEGAKQLGNFLIAALTTAAGVLGWGLHELLGWIRHP